MQDRTTSQSDFAPTGIPGLDDVLRGGLPRNRFYLLEGNPGTGKTTAALRFLLEGARMGESVLYITLSETRPELTQVAASHGWSLDNVAVFELSALEQQLSIESQNTLFHPAEVELNQTTQILLDEVERVNPSRVVLDSLSELRLLSQNRLRFRRQLLAMKQFFSKRECTVIFIDDLSTQRSDLLIQSIAHGVIQLEHLAPEYGAERRRLSVTKLRGLSFRGGYHDFSIKKGGLHVYPRLVAAEHRVPTTEESVSSGIPALDTLIGGGLDRGTSALIIGPSGSGKSTLALQFLIEAAKRGEKSALYTFDENTRTLFKRTEGLGLPLRQFTHDGMINIAQVDPAELSPGEFTSLIRNNVENEKVKIIMIDSLNGYLNSMPNERNLIIQLHELLSYLSQQGVLTVMVFAQHGMVGQTRSDIDFSYLADSVVVLRYFESRGAVRRAISVIKKRTGHHETTIREFRINGGLNVGPPLSDFHGVLTGTPVFSGLNDQMMVDDHEDERA